MPSNPVVYEVNLTIAGHRATEFDTWLQDHVKQMLDLPGFVDATLFDQPADEHDAAVDGAAYVTRRCVHYLLEDQTALTRYFNDHADQMRAAGLARFGNDMSATRRILTRHSDGELCANCQTRLAGQYCAACGQRHCTRMISLWELIRDVVEDALSWDSRVWRSMRPLLLRPGKLTNAYLGGRRAYYTPPLRMYLVLSIAFFLLSSLPVFEGFNASKMLKFDPDPEDFSVTLGPDRPMVTGSTIVTPAEDRSDDRTGNNRNDDVDEQEERGFDCDFSDSEISVPGLSDDLVLDKLRQSCLAIKTAEGRRRFVDEFADLLPSLLIVMLPFTALIGKFIYPLSRRYYVEHLLFYTHFHSFIFLLLIVSMCLNAVGQRVEPLAWLPDLVSAAATLYAVYYLYRALRRVFGQGRWMTLFKMGLIGFSYSVATIILALVGVAVAALSV